MLSVITVVLNDPVGIRKTAESIEQQSLLNFEWIIIDGGSTDDTLKVISGYNSLSPFVFSEEDNGIYDAMNKGIDAAHGDYLIFMNAGDTFANGTVIEVLQQYLTAKSVDVVLGGTWQHINKCKFYRPPKKINWIVHGLPAFHQSTIYKTEILKNRKFDTGFLLLADYESLAKCCVDGLTVGYLDQPISNFFVGGSSYTNIQLKFRDSYVVKADVLHESKMWSFISSVHTLVKTVIVMSILYRICSVFNWAGCRQKKKTGTRNNTTEYYKHR